MKLNIMTLRELLTAYEVNNNKTHAEVAAEAGVALSTYYRWIRGESVNIKRTKMNRLSEMLNVDMEKVIEESKRLKPIIGITKAGYNLEAYEDIEGYIELGKSDAENGDYFLRVEGDSMEGSRIYDGDLLYVQQTDSVRNGQIAIVMIGNESTVKKVYFKNDMLILEASNSKYETRFFTKQEIEELPVRIIGLVRFVRHDLA